MGGIEGRFFPQRNRLRRGGRGKQRGKRGSILRGKPLFLHQFPAQQIARQFLRVADRRRAENKIGVGGVAGADPVQAAEKLADMRSEHAAIGMRLIHNHQRERRKERRPLFMEGQNRQMQHFGVGNQDIGRVLADLTPEMIGRVTVIDGDGRPRRFGPMPVSSPNAAS